MNILYVHEWRKDKKSTHSVPNKNKVTDQFIGFSFFSFLHVFVIRKETHARAGEPVTSAHRLVVNITPFSQGSTSPLGNQRINKPLTYSCKQTFPSSVGLK